MKCRPPGVETGDLGAMGKRAWIETTPARFRTQVTTRHDCTSAPTRYDGWQVPPPRQGARPVSKLKRFFQCAYQAVCSRGAKAAASVVPGGEFLFEVCEDFWKRWNAGARPQDLPAAVGELAGASPAQVKALAAEVD